VRRPGRTGLLTVPTLTRSALTLQAFATTATAKIKSAFDPASWAVNPWISRWVEMLVLIEEAGG